MRGEHELSLSIYRIGNLLDRAAAKELMGLGVSYTQAVILCRLAEFPSQSATQKDIRAYLQVTSASVSTVIKRMVNAGLLLRDEDPKDSRVNVISMTPKAVALVPAVTERLKKINGKMFSGFSQDEIDRFIEMTERMQNNLADCTLTEE